MLILYWNLDKDNINHVYILQLYIYQDFLT